MAVEQTLDLFDESLQHLVLPKSLQRPALNKNDYTVYFTGMLHLLKGFKVRDVKLSSGIQSQSFLRPPCMKLSKALLVIQW